MLCFILFWGGHHLCPKSGHWSSKANKKRLINSGMQKKKMYSMWPCREDKEMQQTLRKSREGGPRQASLQSWSMCGPTFLGPILFIFQSHAVMVWQVVRIVWILLQGEKCPLWLVPSSQHETPGEVHCFNNLIVRLRDFEYFYFIILLFLPDWLQNHLKHFIFITKCNILANIFA